MGHIFISYSHKDTDYAHALADNLQNIGFDVWIDARLDYGSQWPNEIQKQLDACDAFILVMTPRSFASEWVQSELQRAKRKYKPIFPLLLDGNEPWLSIESTQYYDVRDGGFPDARFYAAIRNVAVIRQNAETLTRTPKMPIKVNPPRSEPRFKTEIIVAVIGGLVTVLTACATILLGPVIAKWVESRSPSTPPVIVISVTQSYQSDSAQALPLAPQSSLPTDPPPAPPSPTVEIQYIPVYPTDTPQLIPVVKNYSISQCCNSSGQRSSSIDFSVDVSTIATLKVEFDVASDGSACSDAFLHILWDGEEIRQTGSLGPLSGIYSTGLLNLSSSISKGHHTLTISPEGVYGGCNSGTLGGWAGDLTVQTDRYP